MILFRIRPEIAEMGLVRVNNGFRDKPGSRSRRETACGWLVDGTLGSLELNARLLLCPELLLLTTLKILLGKFTDRFIPLEMPRFSLRELPDTLEALPRLILGAALLVLGAALLVLGAALLVLGAALLVLGAALLVLGAALLVLGAALLVLGAVLLWSLLWNYLSLLCLVYGKPLILVPFLR